MAEDNKLLDYSEDPKIRRGSIDLPFAILVLMLLTIGVVMVLSASYARVYYSGDGSRGPLDFFVHQLLYALAGLVIAYVLSRFPMKFYKKFSPMVLFAALASLALVPLIGFVAGGSRRWINLGIVNFQPSELAKVAVIMYFAALICKYKDKMRTFKFGILPFACILGVISLLLAAEPHFSAVIIVILIGAAMLYLGGVRLYWFVGGFAAVAALMSVVVLIFPYTMDRINTWRDPFNDSSDLGYQIVQSLYAIGSGGMRGLGLGRGLQKYLYLTQEHNDFIFSVVCEELGFVGAAAILLLFALLIIRGYWLALHMTDKYSFLVTAGMTTFIAIQTILNVAVVTNLIPCTGVSLPFFSYGGTALIVQLGAVGVVLSATRDIPVKTTE